MCKVNTCLDTLKPYSTLINSRQHKIEPDSDDVTVETSNCKDNNRAFTAPQNLINIPKDMAIAYTGATGHFLQPGAPAINIKPNQTPISIIIPDG